MRAILVSVDYADLLSVTLPYNRVHFDEVWVVTSMADRATVDVALANDAVPIRTDLFYAQGAKFNKWAALEYGLDVMGRHGWLCLMDADVLWPKGLTWQEGACPCHGLPDLRLGVGDFYAGLHHGQLFSPLRRMCVDIRMVRDGWLPLEKEWTKYPIHQNVAEWAGYSQIFHADDPALGPPPWHEVDWTHAGGADSFFQAKWGEQPPGWKPGMAQQSNRKVRPPFECLHLGEAGKNWYGRATPLLDGSEPEGARERLEACRKIWTSRANRRRMRLDPFEPEKLGRNENSPPSQ